MEKLDYCYRLARQMFLCFFVLCGYDYFQIMSEFTSGNYTPDLSGTASADHIAMRSPLDVRALINFETISVSRVDPDSNPSGSWNTKPGLDGKMISSVMVCMPR